MIQSIDGPINGSDADSIPEAEVRVGPIERRTGKRRVEILVGGKVYGEDVYVHAENDNALTRLLFDVEQRVGLGPSGLCYLKPEILKKAKQADKRAVAVADAPKFDAISCRDLLESESEFDVLYAIEDVLVAHQPAILAGPRKRLKTSLAIELGLTIATTGNRFLGQLESRCQGTVALISAESGFGELKRTAARIAASKGLEPSETDRFLLCDKAPNLTDPKDQVGLANFVKTNGVDLLILDPVYLMLGSLDATNLFAVGTALSELTQLCAEEECGLLLLHHTRKTNSNPHAPPELDDIYGSGFQEFCRQWVLLSRREVYKPGSGEHRLWFSTGGSSGHSGQWALDVSEGSIHDERGRRWETRLYRPDEARQNAQQQRREGRAVRAAKGQVDDVAAAVRALATFPAGETKNVLRDCAGLNSVRFQRAMSGLLTTGRAVAVDVTKSNRKKPYEGYRLVEGVTPNE